MGVGSLLEGTKLEVWENRRTDREVREVFDSDDVPVSAGLTLHGR